MNFGPKTLCLHFKISTLFISLPFIIFAKNYERGH
mgnify:CR=1 FL=1